LGELVVVCGQEWSVDQSEANADRARLAQLYDAHVDAVYAYLARRVGADLALDVLADVFEVAVARLDRFDPGRGSERAWLFGIATNLLRRHWRSEQRRLRAWRRASARESVPGDPLLDVAGRLDAAIDAAVVMAEIGELQPEDRDLLLLIAWEECSYAECAEILDIPVGTVRSRLHRIRRQLRVALTSHTPTTHEVIP
jgi:RNA polymerase sigma-70 factor (ECF subfamily)